MPELTLAQLIQEPNIAALLDDETLASIEQSIRNGYEADVASNDEWTKKMDAAMKLASQVAETKTYPWPGASNVKYPIITTAAIQFAANAYPAIMTGKDIVKGSVIGKKTDEKQERAVRVGEHMSYQLSEQMEEWEEDTDTLLHVLPITGCAYRKMYFSPVKKRNCSEMIMPDRLVKDYNTALADCQRYAEKQEFYPYQVTERVRSGIWRDVELGPSTDEHGDDNAPHKFLEHYCRYDLDEDGYPEPYIVTQNEESGQIVRIVARFAEEDIKYNSRGEIARIEEIQYHIEYLFMPSPDGGKRGWGFGVLLGPLNEAINSTLNMLLDAGHISNTGGGFIGGGMNIPSGNLRFQPGEWKRLKDLGGTIRENIVPLQIQGPSPVLFNLLGFLVEAAQDISSVKDILTGDANRNAPVGTTIALIERGMKVFSAIYKRVHRALKREFKLLYRLNGLYLNPEEYFTILDEEKAVSQQDYQQNDLNVIPVSDPSVVTDMQRIMKAEALVPYANDPTMNGQVIKRRYFEAIGISDIEELFNEKPPEDPQKMIKVAELELKRIELGTKIDETRAKIAKMQTESLKDLADAEAIEAGQQMDQYMKELDLIRAHIDVGRGIQQLEAAPGNGAGAQVPEGLPAGQAGGMG